MARKVKVAVSLSRAVLDLLERHARGRSRSQMVEEELLRALRAREWERLSAQTSARERDEELEWAESSFAATDEALAEGDGDEWSGAAACTA